MPENSVTSWSKKGENLGFNCLSGGDGTEYGEKLTEWRPEVRVRYFF